MQIHTKFSGELSFQVWGADSLDENGDPLPGTKPKQETPFQPQILTDAFFEEWLNTGNSRGSLLGYCGVGNGNAAATASDTTISQIGTRFPISAGWEYSTVGSTLTQLSEYRSNQGQIVGTISEVGLFRYDTTGQTMMRSLIKDGGGAATTLTLTSMDFLYVKWRVTTTLNLSDVVGVVDIGGVNYNYTLRPAQWNSLPSNGTTGPGNSSWPFILNTSNNSPDTSNALGFKNCYAYSTQTLGTVTATGPVGVNYAGSVYSVGAYTAGSKQRKVTYKWNINQGNTGSGIGSILIVGYAGGYQISFSAVSGGATIPKDNTKEFTIGITYSFGR